MIQSASAPIVLSKSDIVKAARASKNLRSGEVNLTDLPDAVVSMVKQILDETSKGHSVAIVSVESDMTTTEAADYLNISRPYLVKLLDQGKLAFHMVGSHKRIAILDVMAYRDRQRAQSIDIMTKLQQEAQDMDMGY